MKKWTLHSFCFITNALSVFLIIIYSFYSAFSGDGFGLVVCTVFFGSLYLIYDYWALQLLLRYREKRELSFTENGIISALLVFVFLLQTGAGYLAVELLGIHVFNSHTIINKYISVMGWMSLLVGTTFISASILFLTTIFLLKAIKKNKLLVRMEIDEIGI